MRNFLIRTGCFLSVMLGTASYVQAQQEPIYSQYMFNGMVINPAYPSMDESSSLTAVGRNQWVGVDGAPRTLSASFYTPIKATNTSLGVSMINEKITVNSQTQLNFNISQRVKLNEKVYIALGLKGGMAQYREDNSSLSTTDPVFAQNQSYWKSDVGFGLMLFTDRFFVGLSSPTFQSFDLGGKLYKVTAKSHYYLQTGYLFTLTDDVKFKPNLLLRAVTGAGLEYDINANVLLKNLVWLGASWRSEKTITGLVQIQATKNLQIGYSYDTPLQSNLRGAQTVSHELMINYRFAWNKWKVVAPRYF
ncbi:type IX secretion system membrane protein, PorP/SprF family [Chitinophaga jiangningensis]|uniref:Type IX secretion system membrane protein, PorP/SprF family n=1 Tax=Chitinophaga jiangningensis TaxID=1419482 RepID=A0A1M6V0B7_9BACT|nr:type IX secretion system membrane protein PorP/SprF [Chitinophaga jiangningensis]SHK74844.1 type IX secretion system membrane protein, PorP/SprF family [Chitinophaga jiangningensis]